VNEVEGDGCGAQDMFANHPRNLARNVAGCARPRAAIISIALTPDFDALPRNKTVSKAFNQWSSSLLMHHRAMVRKGNCPCGLPGRATFKTADTPAVVILCNCEACMGQRDPSSVAVYTDYHEMVAVRGIKHDDTLVRDHTEAESGR
jgi:hypothetical protein